MVGILVAGEWVCGAALYANIVPGGQEAEFTSFFKFAERLFVFLPPLIYTIIFERTGDMGRAIFCVTGFYSVGIVPILFFDEKVGVVKNTTSW